MITIFIQIIVIGRGVKRPEPLSLYILMEITKCIQNNISARNFITF
jgi:hypothetical protein